MTEIIQADRDASQGFTCGFCPDEADEYLAEAFARPPLTDQDPVAKIVAWLREENERLREQLAAAREALGQIRDAWIANNSEGDDYEEGYDDGLKAAHNIARAALTGEAP